MSNRQEEKAERNRQLERLGCPSSLPAVLARALSRPFHSGCGRGSCTDPRKGRFH